MAFSVESENKKRLIVLLPESLAGKTELARAVHHLALQHRADVLYLTLVEDEDKMLGAMRDMATMKAVTADTNLTASSRQVTTRSWIKTLREVYRPGDVLVCHAEQTVRNGPFSTRPMHGFLQETLKAPVIELTGYYRPQFEHFKMLIKNILTWVGFIFILAVFTFLEFNLDTAIHGITHGILLIILLTVEFGTILVWNNLNSK